MEFEKTIRDYLKQVDPLEVVSIIDLELKEYEGSDLAFEERLALEKFHKARIHKLKKKKHQEESFHKRFEYYRAISNVVDYRDILAEKVPI